MRHKPYLKGIFLWSVCNVLPVQSSILDTLWRRNDTVQVNNTLRNKANGTSSVVDDVISPITNLRSMHREQPISSAQTETGNHTIPRYLGDQEAAKTCRASNLRPFDDSVTPEKIVSFYALGDIPYFRSERYCMNEQLRALKVTPPHEDGPSFIVHVGDIRKGSSEIDCNEETYNDIAEIFTHPKNSVGYDPRDCFFVVGDNEWSDCLDPDDGWRMWIEHFGPNNEYGFGKLSNDTIRVKRQHGVERLPGVSRAENFAFFMNNVLFVGLNMVGGSSKGDEEVRLQQNLVWLRGKMNFYSRHDMKALVVIGHADFFGPRRKYFGVPFQRLLLRFFPDLPTMYLHGNGHVFCVQYITEFGDINLVDVEVEAGDFAPPIEISVIRNPENDTYAFAIDQRGGLYPVAGKCPQIKENTWTTPPTTPPIEDDKTPSPSAAPTPSGTPPSTGTSFPKEDPATSMPQPSPSPTEPLPEIVFISDDPPVRSLDVCQGDCDGRKQCKRGLQCFKRKALEPVPGCSLGDGTRGVDVCYDPSTPSPTMIPGAKIQLTPPPTVPPTPTPTHQPTLAPTPIPTNKPTVPPTPVPSPPPTSAAYHRLPVLTFVAEDAAIRSLGACEGACKGRKSCKRGLVCFRKRYNETIPGCRGERQHGVDYCYDPSTPSPTAVSFESVSASPTAAPTSPSTPISTETPTSSPTIQPTPSPTIHLTPSPTALPTTTPTPKPTFVPTLLSTLPPTLPPTAQPTSVPTVTPTFQPTSAPTSHPTILETPSPTLPPTLQPTATPTVSPTFQPTGSPTSKPSPTPTPVPTALETSPPTLHPTSLPTPLPTLLPTALPTSLPTTSPTLQPTPLTTSHTSHSQAPVPTSTTLPPSPAPTEAVVDLPQLEFKGKNVSPEGPKLDACQGDCDGNKDCKIGLVCFTRDAYETVPGCAGRGRFGTDYCYALPKNNLRTTGNNGVGAFPLGPCEGDCDKDADCEVGLKCFRRNATEPVPGCIGEGFNGRDYCWDPTTVI